ncbi:MAG TPA: S-layer homology domain-containing protein [Chloroflexia bacterium]|jgi:hypothetical protein
MVGLLAWVSDRAWAARDSSTLRDSATAAAQPTASTGNAKEAQAQAEGCAPAWQHVAGTDVPGRFSDLKSIEVIAENDVWAVGLERAGTYVSMSDVLMQHWDGSTWTRAPFQDQTLSGWVSELADVDAAASDDVWAVGSANDGVNVSRLLIMHWNGTSWTRLPDLEGLGPQAGLGAVEVAAANDVWAAGFDGTYETGLEALVLHWDGNQWSKVPLPKLGDDVTESQLRAMTLIAPDDIWAVGSVAKDPPYYGGVGHLILHWDGTAWNTVPTTGLEPESSSWRDMMSLVAIDGTASNDVWVVGYHNDFVYNPGVTRDHVPGLFTAHWNGSVWTPVPGPPVDATSSGLLDVLALAPDDVWAVGMTRQLCCYRKTLVVHWDGVSWSVVPSFSEGSGGQLFGIDALPGGELWAAGAYTADRRTQALVERYTSLCPPLPPACAITFSDVLADNTFYPAVRCTACMGIANGYADGTFRPGETVTRGQMAKMTSNAAGFSDPIEYAGPDYSVWADVPVTHTFFIYTQRLAIHDAVEGYRCGEDMPPDRCGYNLQYFHPAEKVTRGQAAQFVSRAAFLYEVVPPGRQTFADVRPGQPFWAEIERVAEHGAIRGYPCGTRPDEPCDSKHRPYFRAAEHVSRGQAAKFLANIFYADCAAQNAGQ